MSHLATAETRAPLTAGDLEVLAFERTRWGSGGRKAAAILARFGLLEPRYYQRLDRIISHPDAEAYDPELVHRLRRVRDARRTIRQKGSASA